MRQVAGGVRLLTMAVVVLGAFLLLGTDAFAQGGAGTQACSADVQSLCKDVKPGGTRLYQCLGNNVAKLSPDCKTYYTNLQAQVKAIGQQCADDIHQYCPTAQQGTGELAQCLKNNQAALTPACRSRLAGGTKK